MTAFKKAYKSTNNYILENVVGARGGSTAVTAMLIDQKYLIVANVGDSRAVLIRKGKVKQITIDHEPQKKEEKEVVESKGGFVIKMPGMHFHSFLIWLSRQLHFIAELSWMSKS